MVILGNNSNIFLADMTILSGDKDILYNNKSCNIIYNHRLISDPKYITKLYMKCVKYNASESEIISISETVKASQTKVTHSNPLYINFTTNTSTYYPGEKLYFQMNVLDTLQQTISDTAMISQINIDYFNC